VAATLKARCVCGKELELGETRDLQQVRCDSCGRRLRVFTSGVRVRLVEMVDLDVDAEALALEPSEAPSGVAEPVQEAPAAGAEPVEAALPEPRMWKKFVLSAWAYPFRGSPKWTFLGWLAAHLVVSGVIGGLFWISAGAVRYGGPLAAFACFMLALSGCGANFLMLGLLAGHVLCLVHQSAWEPEEPPSLRREGGLYESVVRPAGHVAAAAGMSAAPLFLSATAWSMTPGNPVWGPILTLLGAAAFPFLLPINVLAVGVADHVKALDPRATLPAVRRMFKRYWVLSLLCVPASLLSALAPASFAGFHGVGWLLVPVGEAVWLYLLVAAARLLGTFYCCHAEQMGWLKELKREPQPPLRRVTR